MFSNVLGDGVWHESGWITDEEHSKQDKQII